MKKIRSEQIKLEKIVSGGRALGALADGRKVFVWGGLPGETVVAEITKSKKSHAEAIATEIITPSAERTEPLDRTSFLSTSPWQIMSFASEQVYKAALVNDAFALHHVDLPAGADIYTNSQDYGYRNKIEFSWWWENDTQQLDLAFFRRGTHGKIPVDGTSLAMPPINDLAHKVRDLLRSKKVEARNLKTLLIRCNQHGETAFQLYLRDKLPQVITGNEFRTLGVQGGEVIYSDPRCPASVITERLQSFGEIALSDRILGVDFAYATEGFFQINLPVYEQALTDMRQWVLAGPVVDLYSGVGSIGLTIGGENVTLVEINQHAVREMQKNIAALGKPNARAVLAPAENVLDYINSEATIVLDPPRAGLHAGVTSRLLETKPARIIYLSCDPVTQARDVAALLAGYSIVCSRGYNFFPRTPHIEHLVVLEAK